MIAKKRKVLIIVTALCLIIVASIVVITITGSMRHNDNTQNNAIINQVIDGQTTETNNEQSVENIKTDKDSSQDVYVTESTPTITPMPRYNIVQTLEPADFITEVNRIINSEQTNSNDDINHVTLQGLQSFTGLSNSSLTSLSAIFQTSTWEPVSIEVRNTDINHMFETKLPYTPIDNNTVYKMNVRYSLYRDMINAPKDYIQSWIEFYPLANIVDVLINRRFTIDEYISRFAEKTEYCRFVISSDNSLNIRNALDNLIKKYGGD